MDLKNALERFTEGTLTISGGIGIYPSKYPVNIMAKEVERLEDHSKAMNGKNAITIFDENHGYPWDEFENKVLNEKLSAIKEYFVEEDERGMAFLYHLVELLRNTEEKIKTSKIRNLLAMTADIYNEVVNSKEETLSSELIGRINYMKIRFIYEAGREPKVKSLVKEADILTHLDEINGSRKQYILFSHYMEALVAYRKFYGGKDE